MKFKVQSSKFEELPIRWRAKPALRLPPRVSNRQIAKSPNHEINPLPDGRGSVRRGSVLVLVMTLLGILFVLGVAFLATMNFEAEMIASLRQRDRGDRGVESATIDVGSTLRGSMMAAPSLPFGDTSVALSSTAYAEMPGVQNSFSPVEPYWTDGPGPDGQFGTADDAPVLVFGGYFDAVGLAHRPFTGPSLPPGFAINTALYNGNPISKLPLPGGVTGTTTIFLLRCADGPKKGDQCLVSADCQVSATDPPYACEGPRVADADGDGIVDSLLIDAVDIGLSGPQLADLSARLNPPSNPTGKVYIALRVIPHGGLVNLNDSHPNLIANVLGIPRTPADLWPKYGDHPNPNLGNFIHRPTQHQTLYSPSLEESLLRRRALLPPAVIPSSMLQGNVQLDKTKNPTGLADMAWFLYSPKWPGGAVAGNFYNVFDHRYAPFFPGEEFPGNVNFDLWPVRMDLDMANAASAPISPFTMSFEYDRRHLVTTVSQDDLLTRGGTVSTSTGSKDLRQAMIEANLSAYNVNDDCTSLLAFEYADYPYDLPRERDPALSTDPNMQPCDCPTSRYCRFDARKGRLQLSLPYLDTINAVQRERLIHDAFFMLVRNAATPLKVEGMPCSSDFQCAKGKDCELNADAKCAVQDTVCRLIGVPLTDPSRQGYCVHLGNAYKSAFTDPADPGCKPASPCSIPGSICNAGVCELAAPAWRDEPDNSKCRADEFFLITDPTTSPPTGVCADRWTWQRRSQALISRTAASLTANMIDFVDSDNIPTRIAVRNFDFTPRCIGGGKQNLPCNPADLSSCPNGICPIPGSEIDTTHAVNGACASDADCTTANAPVCQMTAAQVKHCIKPLYVYGLERQPYITEVATFADDTKKLKARAIEIFNPYPQEIPASDPANNEEYFIYQRNPSGALEPPVALTGVLQPTGSVTGPFTTFYSAADVGAGNSLLGPETKGTPVPLGPNDLVFEKDWVLYLVRRVQYPKLPSPVDVVVDQFTVDGTYIGSEDATLLGSLPANVPIRFSVERPVKEGTPWTAPVPFTTETTQDGSTLGTWNSLDTLETKKIHPVEIQFANTGTFGPDTLSNVTAAFPTTGSLSLLIRYANRAITDFTPPVVQGTTGRVTNLAFTAALLVDPTIGTPDFKIENTPEDTASMPGSTAVAIARQQQIDNGRMPLFDVGVKESNTATGFLAANHLPPQLLKAWDPANPSSKPLPGDLNMLPWGQLIFDYFTALPLSNPGPYLVSDPNLIGNPEYLAKSQPRVDLDGARVYGRINLNAAPWTVLSGLPFVPMGRIPAEFRTHIAGTLGLAPNPPPESPAVSIGEPLAQAIVAYREARDLRGTGNYNDGKASPGVSGTPPLYPRGWTAPDPVSRRGTGLMSVGELANVRHSGAINGSFRTDSGVIDADATNNNSQNFIDAAAVLIALSDWATIRSQVFTVYGQLRGEEDQTILDPNLATQQRLRRQDADSRALRFQETIDRLPTFFGKPLPRRIGERTIAKLTDVNND